MDKTTINVRDYYGNPSYYSVMPESVFNALESAFLDGQESAVIDRADFERMMYDYKKKMNL